MLLDVEIFELSVLSLVLMDNWVEKLKMLNSRFLLLVLLDSVRRLILLVKFIIVKNMEFSLFILLKLIVFI